MKDWQFALLASMIVYAPSIDKRIAFPLAVIWWAISLYYSIFGVS